MVVDEGKGHSSSWRGGPAGATLSCLAVLLLLVPTHGDVVTGPLALFSPAVLAGQDDLLDPWGQPFQYRLVDGKPEVFTTSPTGKKISGRR